ncbi:Solute carrier family 22 member 4 [Halotydeus destructor]|nr:Solute carrier family 22 member 4 [Halotydeus destructor]
MADKGSAPENSPGNEVNNVTQIIGEWGKWQQCVAIFATVCHVFTAFYTMASSFYAPNIGFTCEDGHERNRSQVFDMECPLNGTCEKWTYDRSVFESTIISEWDLVCSRSWLASLSQSAYMGGMMVSSLAVGYISDTYGRKVALWLSMSLEIGASLASVVSPSVLWFTIFRFVLACGCYGRQVTMITVVTEVVGPKYRALMGVAIHSGWAVGCLLLPAISYYQSNFRYMMLVVTVPEVLCIICLWFMPESPRWLLAKGHFDKTRDILTKAVKINGGQCSISDLDSLCQNTKQTNEVDHQDSSLLDLWRTRKTSLCSFVLHLSWFVGTLAYYAISFNIGDYGGNVFWNFFFSSLVEFPAYVVCFLAMKVMGRRPILTYGSLILAFVCLAAAILSKFELQYEMAITVLVLMAKICSTVTTTVLIVYTSEIYPTVLRQVAYGSCSTVGQIGGMMAPFFKELVS